MNDTLYYLGYREQDIEGEKWLKIAILSQNKLVIIPIYKKKTKDLLDSLETLSIFDNVTSIINFAIRSNGKVALDINF